MSTRIDTKFAELKDQGRTGFVSYIMSGDPNMDTSLECLKGLPSAGADIIELGMCFTDPMADGVAIQLAAQRALRNGQTLPKTLDKACRAGYPVALFPEWCLWNFQIETWSEPEPAHTI